MKKIFLVFLLFSFSIYAQDSLRFSQTYLDKGLRYRSDTNELFTGKAQSYKHTDHLVFEEIFKDGIKLKYNLFFNGKKRLISDEIFYNDQGIKVKRIRHEYTSDFKWITYYNDKKETVLEEDFKNGALVRRCEYLNNKKNGLVFSINEKGEKMECLYENGKLIKKLNQQ